MFERNFPAITETEDSLATGTFFFKVMQIKRNKALFSSRKSKTFYEEIYTDFI